MQSTQSFSFSSIHFSRCIFSVLLLLLLASCGGGGGSATEAGGTTTPINCTVCMTGQPVFSANTLPMGVVGTVTLPISSDVISVGGSLRGLSGDTISFSSIINEGGTTATFSFSLPSYMDIGDYSPRINVSDGQGNSTRYLLDKTISTTQYTKKFSTEYGFGETTITNSGIDIPRIMLGLLDGVPYFTNVPVLDPIPMVAGRPATATVSVSEDTRGINITVHNSGTARTIIGNGSTINTGGANTLSIDIDSPEFSALFATVDFNITDATGNNISRYYINSTYNSLYITQSTDSGVTWTTARPTTYRMSVFDIVGPPAPVIADNVKLSPSVVFAGQSVDINLVNTYATEITAEMLNLVDSSSAGFGTDSGSVTNSTVTISVASDANGDYYPSLLLTDNIYHTPAVSTRYTRSATGDAYEEEQSLDGGITWSTASVMPYKAPTLQVVQPLPASPLMTAAPTMNYQDVDAGYALLVDVPVDASASQVTVILIDSSGNIIGTNTVTSTAAGTVTVAVTIDNNAAPGAYYPMVIVSDGAGNLSRYARDDSLSVVRYTLSQSSDDGTTWPATANVYANIPWFTVAQPVAGAPVLTGAPTYDKLEVLPAEVVTLTLPVTTDTATAEVTILDQACSICNAATIASATVTNDTGASVLVIPLTMGAYDLYTSMLRPFVAKVRLTDASGTRITEYERRWSDSTTYTVSQSGDSGANWITYVGPLATNTVTVRYYSEGTLAQPINIGTVPLSYKGVVMDGGSWGVSSVDDGFDSYYSFTVKPYTAYTYVLSNKSSDVRLRPFTNPPMNDPTAYYCSPDGVNRCTSLTSQGQTSLYAVMDSVYTTGGAQYQLDIVEYPVVTTATTFDFESGAIADVIAQTWKGVGSQLSWAISTLNNSTTAGTNSLRANIPAFENNVCFSISVEGMNTVGFNYIADTVRNNGDFLTFYLNGVAQNQWTSQTTWKSAGYSLTGTAGVRDMLTWCMNRDPLSSGLDTVVGYIDDIVIQ